MFNFGYFVVASDKNTYFYAVNEVKRHRNNNGR